MIKENICSYHGDIKLIAQKLKKHPDPEVQQYATEIYNLAKLAKTAGCDMEARLRLYRETIEGLGFVRKKRKKYERKSSND